MVNTISTGIYQHILVASGNVISALNEDEVIGADGLDDVGRLGYRAAVVAIDGDSLQRRGLSADGDRTVVQRAIACAGLRAVGGVVDVGIGVRAGDFHILSRLIAATLGCEDGGGHMRSQRELVGARIDGHFPIASRQLDRPISARGVQGAGLTRKLLMEVPVTIAFGTETVSRDGVPVIGIAT